jgi:hypothetical protein
MMYTELLRCTKQFMADCRPAPAGRGCAFGALRLRLAFGEFAKARIRYRRRARYRRIKPCGTFAPLAARKPMAVICAKLKFQRIQDVRDCEFIERASCRRLARSGRTVAGRACAGQGICALCARPPGIGSRPFRRDRPVPLEKPFGAQHPLQALGAPI